MQPSTFLSRKRPSKAPLRLTLFQKSPSAFLSLIGHIVKHRGIPGQFLNTGLSVQFGIQPTFIIRKANGLSCIISSAHATYSSSNSAKGTTLLTSPMSRAS